MSSHHRLDTNVPGPLYVTSACIDCDTSRQLAPRIFTEAKGFSAVAHQPETGLEQKQALQALLACPTAAIVSEEKSDIAEAMADFPLLLEDGVHYCGYTSPKSFGGSSYFIIRPNGNWLIDAPRFVPSLAIQSIEVATTVQTPVEDDQTLQYQSAIRTLKEQLRRAKGVNT